MLPTEMTEDMDTETACMERWDADETNAMTKKQQK